MNKLTIHGDGFEGFGSAPLERAKSWIVENCSSQRRSSPLRTPLKRSRGQESVCIGK